MISELHVLLWGRRHIRCIYISVFPLMEKQARFPRRRLGHASQSANAVVSERFDFFPF